MDRTWSLPMPRERQMFTHSSWRAPNHSCPHIDLLQPSLTSDLEIDRSLSSDRIACGASWMLRGTMSLVACFVAKLSSVVPWAEKRQVQWERFDEKYDENTNASCNITHGQFIKLQKSYRIRDSRDFFEYLYKKVKNRSVYCVWKKVLILEQLLIDKFLKIIEERQ